jgi:hypothetical protein
MEHYHSPGVLCKPMIISCSQPCIHRRLCQWQSVKGKVSLEHFIKGGRRAFHLLGNPFANDMNLQMIKDSLDITGDNGSLNGFTTTVTNQPSAFRHDAFIGNDSSGIEAGWVPFTHTNGSAG